MVKISNAFLGNLPVASTTAGQLGLAPAKLMQNNPRHGFVLVSLFDLKRKGCDCYCQMFTCQQIAVKCETVMPTI